MEALGARLNKKEGENVLARVLRKPRGESSMAIGLVTRRRPPRNKEPC